MSFVCAEDNATDTNLEEVTIDANDVSMYYKNGTRLSADLSDLNGNPLYNESIIFNINGVDYTKFTDDDGIASMAINLNPGTYLTNIRFLGNDYYSPANKTVNVNVLPTISGDDLVKYYKNASQYQATFLDGSGEVLDNQDVTFNINGVFYTRQTDQNGVARLNINLNSGTYILTAYNPVDGYSFSNKIKVLSTINGSDLVKIYRDNHQYWATVRDFNGNLLSYRDVEFNVNGVFYTRQSDRNGNARLNINLMAGEYVITAYNKVTGEQASNTILVHGNSNTKLTTQNHVFRENDDDTIVARLTNKLKYGVAGETIDLTIGKNKYSAVTDKDGVATFDLNLKQGNYSLNFNYKGNSVYGASSAKSSVEIYDGIKVHIECEDAFYYENTTYAAYLYDKNNNPFPNQTLYLQLGDMLYSGVTDKHGAAYFDLISPPGIYNAKIFFNETGYKFTKEFRQFTLLENSWTSLIPMTSSVKEGLGEKLAVRLTVGDYNLANKDVIIEINGKNYTRTTDEEGIAYLTINLNGGTYDVNYYYLGDDFFVGNMAHSQLTVIPRIPTQLNVLTGSTYHKNSGITYNIQLKSDKGISGKRVTVKIGSKTFTQTTDGEGIIYLDISGFNEGTYDVQYSFDGDRDYAPCEGSSKLTISPQIKYGFGYWVRYSDMYDLDLASLSSQGTKDLFLHCYAFTAYGESSVASWIKKANNYGINVHIWMQVAYDGGSWHALSTKDGSYNYDYINKKVNEAKSYAKVSGVAGVHFDYLRYGGTAYKYPKAAESINYFVQTAVSAIKSINPNCLVSAALMPEPNNMLYYDGQDYPTLTKYLDFVLPMVYKGNYHQNTAWIQSITQWFVDNSNGAQVWTGLQAYKSDDDVTRLPVSELAGDAQASLNGGASGVVMFRWGVTNFINFNDLKLR